jgi:hypothetical protein
MPQLVKGGKYAFGWASVGSGGKIMIPPEAIAEYKLTSAKVILISGSKTSGGFSITTLAALQASQIGTILARHPELADFTLPEGAVILDSNRLFCWLQQHCGQIQIPAQALEYYGIKVGDQLLAIRGSHLGIGFAVKGPIVEEARKHPELIVFE